MFEYLMPLLVMPSLRPDTLLDETCRAAVRRQIAYGAQRGVPWGMSESGYNTVDAGLNYQYRAFGVPGLGLKRGLAEDLVIAPYASAARADGRARGGLREPAAARGRRRARRATASTRRSTTRPARLRRGESSATVRSFMAHHQGMSLLSLAHLLLDRPMQRRFAADPLFQATLLLLQERIPRATAQYLDHPDIVESRGTAEAPEMPMRVFDTPDTRDPGRAAAVQRPLPRDGHQRRRRLQPLAATSP